MVQIHQPFTIEPGLKKHVIPLLQKYNVDVMLVGHKHQHSYSVVKRDQKILHPEVGLFDEVLFDCSDKTTKEYMPKGSSRN